MYELIYYLKEFGNNSLDYIWFPLVIWTLCCGLAFIVLKNRKKLNPLFHYHLRTAALLSLPFGIGISALMSKIPQWFAASNIETAFFVVYNPIEIVPSGGNSGAETAAINWMEPSLLIGIGTVFIALGSLFMLGRLISSYVALKTLYKNLNVTELQEVTTSGLSQRNSIKLAFHDHPLVPFTFGWKQPVIVLPKILQHEPEKFEMALQHELIHIKRGDYLLQLALSMIESLFWFHPLIHYGNKEIDAYREISCDQEVLSKSDFSIKSYANLLYELVPLSSGAERLSVSMAVKNSTLKKRIKTMKYHKLHKASFRQSIAFLMLMIVGITLPIACSDLRGPQSLSEEELENTRFQVSGLELEINGENVIESEPGVGFTTTGIAAFILNAKDYGVFKISPVQFKEGMKAGKIDGDNISFTINELNVVVKSTEDVLPEINSQVDVWVEHYPAAIKGFSHGVASPFKSLDDYVSEYISSVDQTKEDYFVVVEEMPVLIGGMKSLQSKVEYTDLARRAGIEGRVTVQFIVNENGDVENPQVVRGIGGGLDESALAAVREAKFEPGIQRGKPVRVQYAVSINFRLEDSDFSTSENAIQREQGTGLNR
ncbi:MAG: M56 family metallopeptidase [Gracilimonas sp.]|uniref:M56 family metallopeptidase n=1 Tax=Gracilimonas sp. TaxID=1974203 RepID=UPI0019A7EFA4|nr:M56 family metallopeptidase [Gracilimonas sp.]MBD3616683.1 M56 family metallopeptidase [Gracilimonas sp.]